MTGADEQDPRPHPPAPAAEGGVEPSSFGRWRGQRPFWGGLWMLLGGVVITVIPLSDPPAFLATGSTGVTAVLPGVVLLLTGAYAWFSPPNRTLAGVLGLVFSVASFALSNLGGLVVGMLLGLLGSAMTLAWTDQPRRRRGQRRSGGTEAGVLLVVSLVGTVVVAPSAAATVDGCGGGLLGSVACGVGTGVDRLLGDTELPELPEPPPVTEPLERVLEPEQLPGEPRDGAEQDAGAPADAGGDQRAAAVAHDEGHLAPLLRSELRIPDLAVVGFTYDGVVTVPTREGPVQVLRFLIDRIAAEQLEIVVPTALGDTFSLGHGDGTVITGDQVVLDCTAIQLTLTGLDDPSGGLSLPLPLGVPLSFRADEPGDPLLALLALAPGLALTADDVDIELVTLSADDLVIPEPLAVIR